MGGATWAEEKLLMNPGNLWVARKIFENRNLAFQKTEELFKGKSNTEFNNDEADAFRHAFFNALNTQSMGKHLANALGKAHEELDYPNQVKLNMKMMDLHWKKLE